MPEFTRDKDEIGALWEKTGAKGAYMTGTINGQRVVVFRTKFGAEGAAPQWRVLKAQPKVEETADPDGPAPF